MAKNNKNKNKKLSISQRAEKVTKLYDNVLDRKPDVAGMKYWTGDKGWNRATKNDGNVRDDFVNAAIPEISNRLSSKKQTKPNNGNRSGGNSGGGGSVGSPGTGTNYTPPSPSPGTPNYSPPEGSGENSPYPDRPDGFKKKKNKNLMIRRGSAATRAKSKSKFYKNQSNANKSGLNIPGA